jgi:hypothetical protein
MAKLEPIPATICPGRPRAGVSVPIRWRLPSDHALDPDTIRALIAACKDAWREVHGRDSIAPHRDLRDKLTRLIIGVAERGHRDPIKLRAYAVTFLRVALPHKRG